MSEEKESRLGQIGFSVKKRGESALKRVGAVVTKIDKKVGAVGDDESLRGARETILEQLADPERLDQLTQQVGRVVTSSSDRTADALLRSREERLAMANQGDAKPSKKLLVFKTAIEMIPGPVFGYGPGDLLTLTEGIMGKEIGTGRQLDRVDRFISLVAAGIPVVPATPFREAVRVMRVRLEDTVAQHTQQEM